MSQYSNNQPSYNVVYNMTKLFVESLQKHSNCPSDKKIFKYIQKKYNSKQLISLLKHIIYGNTSENYIEINWNKLNKIEYLSSEILNPLKWLIMQFKPISNTKIKTNKFNYTNCAHYLNFVQSARTPRYLKQKLPKWWNNSSSFIHKTLLATCHFIQSCTGTGIHIGNGYILTCSHVVESEIFDEEYYDDSDNFYIGTIKWIMFANGIIYCCQCIAIHTSTDSRNDLALLKIIKESEIDILIDTNINIGCSIIAKTAPKLYAKVFCIGNPSDIDLETNLQNKSTNFNPVVWHLSFGKIEAKINDNMEEKEEKQQVDFTDLSGYAHSCWTYWGHSGAPIFDINGNLVAIHSSWNDKTGMRHAVEYEMITKFISQNI